MSAGRSCVECRAAKVKCDRRQPSCSRCIRRGLTCNGLLAGGQFIFCDQRQVARINSQRARGELFSSSPDSSPSKTGHSALALQHQYPWLNAQALAAIPTPLMRDVDSRAVDRLFLDWTLYPSQDGASPGFMHTLPALYQSAADVSVLRHAVRALAFADLGRGRDDAGVPYALKARANYGRALHEMHALAADGGELGRDDVVAALLLMDSFESMYLNSQEQPLGVHTEAVKLAVRSRGIGQLLDPAQFALWRMANCRLQARQIQSREEPDESQIELLGNLNVEYPDMHIARDVSKIASFCAAAERLVSNQNPSSSDNVTTMALQLLTDMQNLVVEIDAWTSNVPATWRPLISESSDVSRLSDLLLVDLEDSRTLVYKDVWIAYIWNFHAASQIVLREYAIDIAIRLLNSIAGVDCEAQQAAVKRHADHILCSSPPLIGFTDASGQPLAPSFLQGQVAGRFLTLFALNIVTKAKFTSETQKNIASELTRRMYAIHAVD